MSILHRGAKIGLIETIVGHNLTRHQSVRAKSCIFGGAVDLFLKTNCSTF